MATPSLAFASAPPPCLVHSRSALGFERLDLPDRGPYRGGAFGFHQRPQALRHDVRIAAVEENVLCFLGKIDGGVETARSRQDPDAVGYRLRISRCKDVRRAKGSPRREADILEGGISLNPSTAVFDEADNSGV